MKWMLLFLVVLISSCETMRVVPNDGPRHIREWRD
jgi:hypothetical protein